jgi:thiol-disulfide isomerase/thioredoxin
MRADIAGARCRHVAAAGLLAAGVLVLAACGGVGDDGAATDSGSAAAVTAPMTDPSPMATGGAEPTGEAEATEGSAAEMTEAPDEADEEADLAVGTYRDFSEEALAEPGYETNVIFFHASWCPECRAFEQSIEAGPIPDGVQILKADYDTETALKQKYVVDIQTTFVKVDDSGEMISKWVGYEQDRSVDNLLEQLG